MSGTAAAAAATIRTTQPPTSHAIDPRIVKFAAQILADPNFQRVATCDDGVYDVVAKTNPLLKWGIDQVRATYAGAQRCLDQ